MTADLSPAEAATVQRFEAAPDAEESLRERVARAIYDSNAEHAVWLLSWANADWGNRVNCYRQAEAAIAAMRGES